MATKTNTKTGSSSITNRLDRAHKKGIAKGLDLAARYLERTSKMFRDMATQSFEQAENAKVREEKSLAIANGNRFNDKADLLRGQAELIRSITFKEVKELEQ